LIDVIQAVKKTASALENYRDPQRNSLLQDLKEKTSDLNQKTRLLVMNWII
jgi:tryptophan 2,3-dioxygenase